MLVKNSMFNYKKAQVLQKCFAVFFVLFIFFFIGSKQSVFAATRTWDGGGSDGTCGGVAGDGNKWSCATNWSADTAPTSADDVVFNNTSTKNATIDSSFAGTVNNFTIASTYSGNITQARTLTINAAFSQAGGTFTGSSTVGHTIVTTGNFSLSGGVFVSTVDTLTLRGSSFSITAGTFTHNSGTLSIGNNVSDITLACNNAVFSNISISPSGSDSYTITVGSDCTLPLGTNPTSITNLINNGTVTGSGTWNFFYGTYKQNSGATFSGFSGLSVGPGYADKGVIIASGSTFPNNVDVTFRTGTGVLSCNGATLLSLTLAGTATLASSCTTGAVTLNTGGTLDLNGYTFTDSGNFTNSGGTLTANLGTVLFTGTTNAITGSNTFYDLTKTNSGAVTFVGGTTQTITHTLTLQGTSRDSNDRVRLSRAEDTTGAWRIDPQGTRTLDYVWVQYSNNINSTQIVTVGHSIVDGGNNTGWNFPAPYNPTSLGPSSVLNGTYSTNTTPSFEFTLSDSDSTQTVRYEIQIALNSNFSTIVVDYASALYTPTGSGTKTYNASFTVGQTAESGGEYATCKNFLNLYSETFYWRVRTINFSGTSSDWASGGSPSFYIDTASPESPGQPTTTTPTSDTTPTWTWTASTDLPYTFGEVPNCFSGYFTGAASGLPSSPYQVQWANNSSFNNATTYSSYVSMPFTQPSALSDGTWYFRVRAIDNVGNISSWSLTGAVVIDTSPPSSFSLESPDSNAYINTTRPTFVWKTIGDGSGISYYKLTIDNGSGKGFSVDGIPSSGTTDIVKSNYVVHYAGFTDGDENNNYVSVYTKASKNWDSTANDGKLIEGIRAWTVTAYDSLNNPDASSRVVYVDITAPTFSDLTTSYVDRTPQRLLITANDPTYTGKIMDNFFPTKIEVTIDKVNYVLGSLESISLYTFERYTLNNPSNLSSLLFSLVSAKRLEYGIYRVHFVGYDKAGNFSKKATINLQYLPSYQVKKLAKNTPKKFFSFNPISKNPFLNYLGNSFLLRRYMEADIWARFVAWVTSTASQTGSLLYEEYKMLGVVFTDKNSNHYNDSVKIAAFDTQQQTNKTVAAIFSPLTVANEKTTVTLQKAQQRIKKQITTINKEKTRKILVSGKASRVALNYSFHNQQDTSYDLPKRLQVGFSIFTAYLFNKDITQISHVKLEMLGKDYAVISWRTNQETIKNQLNYGMSKQYGQTAFTTDGNTYHKVRLNNLRLGKTYYFEVMSQGKNFVFDAYYSFTTLTK